MGRTYRGSPALGVRLADPLAFFRWGSVNDRPPMAEPPWWGLRKVVLPRRFVVSPRFFWFSGLFLNCRRRIDVILLPLYGRKGPCFVRFEGRLTLQTWRNAK